MSGVEKINTKIEDFGNIENVFCMTKLHSKEYSLSKEKISNTNYNTMSSEILVYFYRAFKDAGFGEKGREALGDKNSEISKSISNYGPLLARLMLEKSGSNKQVTKDNPFDACDGMIFKQGRAYITYTIERKQQTFSVDICINANSLSAYDLLCKSIRQEKGVSKKTNGAERELSNSLIQKNEEKTKESKKSPATHPQTQNEFHQKQKEFLDTSKEERFSVLDDTVVICGIAMGAAGTYKVNRIFFKDLEGTQQEVRFVGQIIKGTKEYIQKNVLSILKSKGIFLNLKTFCLERINIHSAGTDAYKDFLNRVTYNEFCKLEVEQYEREAKVLKGRQRKKIKTTNEQLRTEGRNERKLLSKEQFEKMKIESRLELRSVESKYSTYVHEYYAKQGIINPSQEQIAEATTGLGGKLLSRDAYIFKNLSRVSTVARAFRGAMTMVALEYAMLPTFTERVRVNNQDIGEIAKDAGGIVAFLASAKAGALIGGGFGMLVGGAIGMLLYETKVVPALDKATWKSIPNREDFFDKKLGMESPKWALIGYIATGKVVVDASDKSGLTSWAEQSNIGRILGFSGTGGIKDMNPREWMKGAGMRGTWEWDQKIDTLEKIALEKLVPKIVLLREQYLRYQEQRGSWNIVQLSDEYASLDHKYRSMHWNYIQQEKLWGKDEKYKSFFQKEWQKLDLCYIRLQEKGQQLEQAKQKSGIRDTTKKIGQIAVGDTLGDFITGNSLESDINSIIGESGMGAFSKIGEELMNMIRGFIQKPKHAPTGPDMLKASVTDLFGQLKFTKKADGSVGSTRNSPAYIQLQLEQEDRLRRIEEIRWRTFALGMYGREYDVTDIGMHFAKDEHYLHFCQFCDRLKENMINKKPLLGVQEDKDMYNGIINDNKASDVFVQLLNELVEYKRSNEFLDNIATYGMPDKY